MDEAKPKEFWIAEMRKGSKHYWASAISTNPRCKEMDKDFENAIHVIEYSYVEELKTIIQNLEGHLGHSVPQAMKLVETKENILAKFLAIERDTQVMLNNALSDQNMKLQAERDGARAALEDRDKMHAEHIKALEADRMRLIAELKEYRSALEFYDRQLYCEQSEFGSPEYTMEELENRASEVLAKHPRETKERKI